MIHSNIFLNHDFYNEETNIIVKYLENNPVDRKGITGYCNNIFEFIKKFPLPTDKNIAELRILIYNYWYIQFVYTRHQQNKNTFAESTFHQYFIAATRIIELAVVILSRGDRLMPFLNEDNEKVLYKHFKSLDPKLVDRDISIVIGKVIIFENQYTPRHTIRSPKKSKTETELGKKKYPLEPISTLKLSM